MKLLNRMGPYHFSTRKDPGRISPVLNPATVSGVARHCVPLRHDLFGPVDARLETVRADMDGRPAGVLDFRAKRRGLDGPVRLADAAVSVLRAPQLRTADRRRRNEHRLVRRTTCFFFRVIRPPQRA